MGVVVFGPQPTVVAARSVRPTATVNTRAISHDPPLSPVPADPIADQRPGHRITLFACHPPGSATYRFVTGELVG